MSQPLNLSGRTVLITGPARGIGNLLAREVARRGARLSLVGTEPDLIAKLADSIRAEHGVDVFCAEADVRDRAAIDAAVAGTVDSLGGIDVVVANAGVETAGSLLNMDAEEFRRVVDVNLYGVFNTLHATLPHVIERRGHLLPIASVAAVAHAPGMAPYAASKAAVEALADVLRQELAGTGTTVGCGYFSFLDTDMVRDAFARPEGAELRNQMRGPLGKVYPVEPAVQRLADGIEGRTRTVVYPPWARAVISGHGVIQPLAEKLIGSRGAEALRKAESES